MTRPSLKVFVLTFACIRTILTVEYAAQLPPTVLVQVAAYQPSQQAFFHLYSRVLGERRLSNPALNLQIVKRSAPILLCEDYNGSAGAVGA